MTQVDAQRLGAPQAAAQRFGAVPRIPRQFNAVSRRRFIKAYVEHHLARVSGQPTVEQVEWVQSMAILEWTRRLAVHEGSLGSLREARDAVRVLRQVLADFEASLAPRSDKKRVTNHLSDLHSRYGTPR